MITRFNDESNIDLRGCSSISTKSDTGLFWEGERCSAANGRGRADNTFIHLFHLVHCLRHLDTLLALHLFTGDAGHRDWSLLALLLGLWVGHSYWNLLGRHLGHIGTGLLRHIVTGLVVAIACTVAITAIVMGDSMAIAMGNRCAHLVVLLLALLDKTYLSSSGHTLLFFDTVVVDTDGLVHHLFCLRTDSAGDGLTLVLLNDDLHWQVLLGAGGLEGRGADLGLDNNILH